MKRSDKRILTTHAGALPRPEGLRELVTARNQGQPYDEAALAGAIPRAVAEVVQHQIQCGVDVPNDGELSKPGFSEYVRERIRGFEVREFKPGEGPPQRSISGRDHKEFGEYFATLGARAHIGIRQRHIFCVGPLQYLVQAAA